MHLWVICGLLWLGGVEGSNVLMVIGGQFFNTTSRHHETVSSVEVIGEKGLCEIAGLPTPLYGMSAGRIGNRVLVCGGFYYYYRNDCYEFEPNRGTWLKSRISLDSPNAFMGGLDQGGRFFMAGGRNFIQGDGRQAKDWHYYTTLMEYKTDKWRKVVDLPEPLADLCMARTEAGGRTRLWIMGGSNSPQRYKSAVYSLELEPSSRQLPSWKKMPDMPEERMWQKCTAVMIQGSSGILVAGGYYNGGSSMWLPLQDRAGNSLETYGVTRDQPKWEWLSSLTSERKWGAAMGYIGDKFALAGGGDYGDNTIEVLEDRDWRRLNFTMKFKREFTAGVTVPSEWFPHCNL